MATKDVYYDRSGPPLSAEVRTGHAQEGAYALTLWEGNDKIERWEGNFLNPDDDSYPLPGVAADHDGRLLQAKIEIGLIPPVTTYSAVLIVRQGSQDLDTVDEEGDGGDRSLVPVNLFAHLKAR